MDQIIPKLSHELRNQLVPIFSLSEMIKDQCFGNIDDIKNKQEYLEAAKTIHNSASEMLEFLDDLMESAITNVGCNKDGEFEFSVNLQNVDICCLINRAIKVNQISALSKNITIIFQPTKQFVSQPKLDPKRIKQILINLISNSIKYSKHSTEIVISCDVINAHLVISIKDQGIGMTKEQIEMALSGEGTKIDKSELITKSNPTIDSHGIGLPLVKKLTELQKGILEINSIKDQGTEVLLKFPIAR